MSRLAQTICSLLAQGEELVVATILSHEGSTPRTAGTKMVIRSGGDSIATVGGGLVEAEVVKAADEVLRERRAQIRAFDLTGQDIAGMDLVCGGRLEILIELMSPTRENKQVFQGLVEALQARKKSLLVADLGPSHEPGARVARSLVLEDGTVLGDLAPPPRVLEILAQRAAQARYPVLVIVEGHRYSVEACLPQGTVYLFGAGHVSQQVAPLAKLVNFATVVMDDRTDFANRQRFPDADEIRVLDSFDRSLEGLDIDGDSYIVIVTRGHLHDKTVLRAALRTAARYIGMIGSRIKRDRIFRELEAEGFTMQDFARVCSPIGLDIGAETPEEIGISIVGELVRQRAAAKRSETPKIGEGLR
jgi:xanthine dehydrogenase accessory factor